MERMALIQSLISILLEDMPQYTRHAQRFSPDIVSRRRLLRSLMNVRPPMTLTEKYLAMQDELLSLEREEKGVVDAMTLPSTSDPRIVLWQGDITRLKIDATVNAGNSALLGCFSPCHDCVDNAIHSAAGLQLREECHRIMVSQGHEEPPGRVKITKAYNLPGRYVLHTVGPIVQGRLRQADHDLLASCYRSCLELAANFDLQSVAFCCISTGEFHFPNDQAAEIAVKTVKDFLAVNGTVKRVVFDVFKTQDLVLYQKWIKTFFREA